MSVSQVFVASGPGLYRKPVTGMFNYLCDKVITGKAAYHNLACFWSSSAVAASGGSFYWFKLVVVSPNSGQ